MYRSAKWSHLDPQNAKLVEKFDSELHEESSSSPVVVQESTSCPGRQILLEDKSFLFIFGNMFLPSASAKFKIRSKTLVWQKTPKIKKLGLRLWEEIKKLRF